MGKEHPSRHQRTAREILREKGISVREIKIEPRASQRFREDRKETELDKETQLRRRFGNSIEIDPHNVPLHGKKETETLHGLMFEDRKNGWVYYVRVNKNGSLSLTNILIPHDGKGGLRYNY